MNSQDSLQCIQGKNGVTEHGIVTDRADLARMTSHGQSGSQFELLNDGRQEFIESSQSLKIICQYNNLWNDEARFHFKIKNVGDI